ncbi:MAG: putative sugar O-methyltransferase [Pseudomonadota bacterium]|nr:putative sugar O-methyltransferase [Pseudomonadota bacterium]
MRADDASASPLWKRINATALAVDRLNDLSDFKSSDVNFRLALWNPHTNGVRYLKTLIYNLCAALTPAQLARLATIKNRGEGQPISITYEGQSICMDYLQALYEIEFVSAHMSLEEADVLEIGAGYGRTAHAFLSCFPIASYTIVDLPNCLELSRRYLSATLDAEQYARIAFMTPEAFSRGAARFDLCLNIDSFAEMEAKTARNYLCLIDATCRCFYTKNPVGKYRDASLSTALKRDEAALALEMGLLREVLDIHDNRAVAAQRQKFLAAYRPGDGWSILADGWAPPWSFYWQAIYRRCPAGKAGEK